MTYPEISKDFTMEDIWKIREYNSERHIKMTPKEIVEDTKKGAERILQILEAKKMKVK